VPSQNRADRLIENGFWERDHPGRHPARRHGHRPRTTAPAPAPPLEAVALKPAFRPDGTVTAGNACPLNDGAAAVVVMSDTKAKELGLTPLARIVSSGVSGLNPEIMGLGPVEAIRKALARPA
jgi:acetyl-CoA C-acetyltransferase